MNKFRKEEIEIDLIDLDPNNPRIPASLHGKNEEEIIEHLIDTASIIELIDSIGENDFFPGEPIILVENGDRYTVVEGNRRVTALKLLQKPDKATILTKKIQKAVDNAEHKPKRVESLIANNRDDIYKFLGFRHITGVKNWNALEKARYLFSLNEKLILKKPDITKKELYLELARAIGSKSPNVARSLAAYNLYLDIEEHNFYKIKDLNDTTLHFVNISDSLTKKNLRDFLGVDLDEDSPTENLNSKNLKEWTHWLFEKNDQFKTRVKGKSDQLTMLSEIIGNPKALIAFRDGKLLEDAALLTEHIDNIFNTSVSKSLTFIKEAQALATSMGIDGFYTTLTDDLKEIVEQCNSIKRTHKAKEEESEGSEFELQ